MAENETVKHEDYLRDKDDPLYWQMREEHEAFLRRQYWWWFHYHNGTLCSQRRKKLQQLAREAERIVAEEVRSLGYYAYPTTHKCPFDLWVEDNAGRMIKVEVKISLYYVSNKGGRYQADVRHHDQADLLVFIARNGQDWPFVIPMADIAPRRNIAIWSYYPRNYSGQWAPYLKKWEHLHRAIEASQPQIRQQPLFQF